MGAVDPTELQVMTISYATLQNGARIQTVLSESLVGELAESLGRYGVPLAQVETLKPAFLMNQIVLLRLSSLGYQGEHGVEQHYLRQLGNRRVLELETLDEQLNLLFNQPMDLQQQLLIDTLKQEADIEPLVAGMIGAFWAAGLDGETAARSAAYWHGVAGAELAARRVVTADALVDQVAVTTRR